MPRGASSLPFLLFLLFLLGALAASACSGGGGSNGSPPPAHAPLPTVNDSGGGILANPTVVTVSFDPSLYTGNATPPPATLVSDLQTFDDAIMQTAWWDTIRAGYCEGSTCVGEGAPGAHVSLVGANAPSVSGYIDSVAAQSTSTLQPYIQGLLASGALPAPGASTFYLFYFPLSIPITLDGARSCETFGGYHNTLAYQASGGGGSVVEVPYAVVSICDPPQTRSGVAQLSLEQTATMAASHEIIETVTDPYAGEPGKNPQDTSMLGYDITTTEFLPWALTMQGGEVADLCADLFGFGTDRWAQGAYTVTRVWSNGAAAASHDPCVPTPAGEVYFNAAPAGGNDALAIAVGESVTFEVDAFSDGPTADWTLGIIDLNGNVDPSQPGSPCDASENVVCFSLSATSVNNGSKVTVTATLNSPPPAAAVSMPGTAGFEPYMIFSFATTSTAFHIWPGVVVAAAPSASQ